MSWLRRYVAFWDRREPVAPMALVRIGLGAVLTFDLVLAWALGMVPVLWGPYPEGGLAKVLEPAPEIGVFWTPTTQTAWVLWGVATAASAALTIGLATPVACATAILATAHFGHLSGRTDTGIDILLRWALLILLFARSGATWSVDAWVRHRRLRRDESIVPAWPRTLMIGQLVLVYFAAGLAKASPRWTPWGGATAVYLVMEDPTFSRLDPGWLTWGFPITQVMTVTTFFWELSSPLVLLSLWARARPDLGGWWWRMLGRYWLAYILIGAGFHVSLMFTMRLGIFPYGVLAMYPAWFHRRELVAIGEAIRTRRLAPLRILWDPPARATPAGA